MSRRLLSFSTLLASLALLLAAHGAQAANFDVRTANLRETAAGWVLTARIDYALSRKAIDALNSGVELSFRVELNASRLRRMWFDPEVIEVSRDWRLAFDALTKRYRVAYPDGREPTSHATLFGALNAIGRVQELPVAPPGALDSNRRYDIAVRAVLDQQTLPGPLQVLAFWDDGFSLESDWYEWTVAP
jgi:Domain of unknown function (DUF4390)